MTDLITIDALSAEERELAATMPAEEARWITDAYYQMQNQRLRTGAQMRSAEKRGAAYRLTAQLNLRAKTTENLYRSLLHAFAKENAVGEWALSIMGIGPVIAAGLLAHIDIKRAPSVANIWRYAGLDPTVPRPKKGVLRRHNAKLKNLAWLTGESFVRTKSREGAYYGKLYDERKVYETAKNARLEYAEQAKILAQSVGEDTKAYAANSKGMLSDGHIHERCKRWAVKIFLCHWHHVAHEVTYKVPPAKPFILTREGHTHYLAPPNW